MSPRRKILSWLLGAGLLLIVAAMLVAVYALGPVGSCEDELNNGAIFLTWLLATGASVPVAYAFFVVATPTVVPAARSRYLLGVPVCLGAAATTFAVGLVIILTNTACVD